MTDARSAVLLAASEWIGTPYCHQASVKGAGCDCLGLIRGVWREIYGAEPMPIPPYTPDWAEATGAETLLSAAQKCLRPIETENSCPGDVLVFRMRPNAPCKHMAILSAPDRIIHAYWGRTVIESHLVPYWSRRWVYSFSFPDLKEI